MGSTNYADYQQLPLPLVAMAKDLPGGGYRSDYHCHPHRCQLLYATSGVLRILTQVGAWVVPPLRAVWIPNAIGHYIRSTMPVALRTAYVDPDAAPSGLRDCRVVKVSPLLRELLVAATRLEIGEQSRRAKAITLLLLDELAGLDTEPLCLPLPNDPRLQRVCTALLDNPGRTEGLEDWATEAGASARTLARLFRRETGLRFVEWRQQARLAEAFVRLGQGRSVKSVAHGLGYQSVSAFAAMFRRAYGETPKSFAPR